MITLQFLSEQPPVVPYHLLVMQDVQHMIDNKLIWLLILLIILDIASGYAKSFITKQTNSSVGFKGLTKHTILVLAVIFLYPQVDAAGYSTYGDIVLLFYVFNYAISFAENCGAIGLPVPAFLKDRLIKLRDDYDKGGK